MNLGTDTKQLRADAQAQLESVATELSEAQARVAELSALHKQLVHVIDTLDNGVGTTKRRKAVSGTGVTIDEIVAAYGDLRAKYPGRSIEDLEAVIRKHLKERGRRLQGFGNRWSVALERLDLNRNGVAPRVVDASQSDSPSEGQP